MTREPRTMREAVDRLRLNRATALEELQEFEGAMNELWQAIAALVASIHGLTGDLQGADQLGSTGSGASSRGADRALRISVTAQQVVSALGEICRGVRAWSIAERAVGGEPRSLIATPVPRRAHDDLPEVKR